MIIRIASIVCVILFPCQAVNAGITLGLLDDFEDGSLEGWSPPKANTSNVPGGPTGSTRMLEIRSAGRLAAFDAGPDVAGTINPTVNAIEVGMSRNLGANALEIRLVLFGPGPGNRWTSTQSQILPGDGMWNTHSFSILEADLTQVAGDKSYSDLVNNLNRIMFRHDSGGPSAQGTPIAFTADPFYIDNVTAAPEPSTLGLLSAVFLVLVVRKTR